MPIYFCWNCQDEIHPGNGQKYLVVKGNIYCVGKPECVEALGRAGLMS